MLLLLQFPCHLIQTLRTFATTVEHRLSHLFAIGKVLNILWHFEILTWQSEGKLLKYAITWKWLIVERNGWKMGFAVLGGAYVGYFSCPILWVWFAVIRCTLQISSVYLCKISSVHLTLFLITSGNGLVNRKHKSWQILRFPQFSSIFKLAVNFAN